MAAISVSIKDAIQAAQIPAP